jgi:hypothetical protein
MTTKTTIRQALLQMAEEYDVDEVLCHEAAHYIGELEQLIADVRCIGSEPVRNWIDEYLPEP